MLLDRGQACDELLTHIHYKHHCHCAFRLVYSVVSHVCSTRLGATCRTMRSRGRQNYLSAVFVACAVAWSCDWFGRCWSQGSITGAGAKIRSAPPFEGRASQLNIKRQAAKGFQSAKDAGQAPKRNKNKKKKRASTKKVAEKKAPAPAPEPPAPVEEVDVDVIDPNESDEDREFRERYLSAEKEEMPDWQSEMKAAKTKEERFKVGLRVGDFGTSYTILFQELISSFVSGDKEQLDDFLMEVGIAQWQLALIQVVVLAFPLAVITYSLGFWKF
eukprot:s601_g2.t1